MRAVTVYRVEFARMTKYPVGVVMEQRQTERRTTVTTCLWLARRLLALDAADAANIIINVNQARRVILPDQTRGVRRGSFEETASL